VTIGIVVATTTRWCGPASPRCWIRSRTSPCSVPRCDGGEAVRVCRELRPDVVLMDVRMPSLDGIEATRQLADADEPGRGC